MRYFIITHILKRDFLFRQRRIFAPHARSIPVHEQQTLLRLSSALRGHVDLHLRFTATEKIDRPAPATDTSSFLTISRFLTTQLHLQPTQHTKTLSWSSRFAVGKTAGSILVSTAQTFNTAETMQPHQHYTHVNLSCTTRQVHAWHFNLTLLSLSSFSSSSSITFSLQTFAGSTYLLTPQQGHFYHKEYNSFIQLLLK